MRRKNLIYGLIILAAVIAWAAFRPERLFVNAKVNETIPVTASDVSQMILASGTFHGVAHNGSGSAAVYQLADGKRILRLTNFATSNGPDVHVYLVAANDATNSEIVKKAGFREIGSLKGNIGDQNYEIPADVDLAKYRAVTIWCRRFGVNFATAPLSFTHNSPAGAQVLLSGTFHNVAHKGLGQATVYQLGDGKLLLRFTNFETSNGPDVHVYLVATKDARDSETVKQAGFVGKLDAISLRAGAPAIAPGFTLQLMAKHSLDFWLTSEDLPDPNNRVTVNRAGEIVLTYTPNNVRTHEQLKATSRGP
jgi:electron transfer DM13